MRILGGRLSLSMVGLASPPHMHIIPRPQQVSASSTRFKVMVIGLVSYRVRARVRVRLREGSG